MYISNDCPFTVWAGLYSHNRTSFFFYGLFEKLKTTDDPAATWPVLNVVQSAVTYRAAVVAPALLHHSTPSASIGQGLSILNSTNP